MLKVTTSVVQLLHGSFEQVFSVNLLHMRHIVPALSPRPLRFKKSCRCEAVLTLLPVCLVLACMHAVFRLQLVEKIMDCSRAGKLQEVVAEKRSVLTSMQQVLQSCYALLDSTQVPLHSIIRLLQHILRYGGSAGVVMYLHAHCISCPARLPPASAVPLLKAVGLRWLACF